MIESGKLPKMIEKENDCKHFNQKRMGKIVLYPTKSNESPQIVYISQFIDFIFFF